MVKSYSKSRTYDFYNVTSDNRKGNEEYNEKMYFCAYRELEKLVNLKCRENAFNSVVFELLYILN